MRDSITYNLAWCALMAVAVLVGALALPAYLAYAQMIVCSLSFFLHFYIALMQLAQGGKRKD